MNDESQISETEARANLEKWKGILKGIKKNKTTRKDHALKLAKELESFTENILAAQKSYIEKGFEVTIEVSPETGLVTKWKLANKYPKRIRVGGDAVNNIDIQADKTMSVEEFNSIVNLLGDGELSSKDIHEALKQGKIGKRKLQPTLGNILNGMFGKALIEKANDVTRGPGVRYRKVK